MESTAPKGPSNRNIIIIVAAALLLCCCCLALGVGGYYAYQAYVAAQQVVEQIDDFEIPTNIPADPNNPNSPQIPVPGFDLSGDVPQGGLADEQTRYFAWASLQIVAAISECNSPTASGTTIRVVQEPAGSGSPWVEEWNVDCGDGTSKPFRITFTPENGVVNVSVEIPGIP